MERQPCNHKGIEEGAHIIHSPSCNENGNAQIKEIIVPEAQTNEQKAIVPPARVPISTGT